MTFRKFTFIHLILFLMVAIFNVAPWPFLMLTVAQLLYIPIVLNFVMRKGDWLRKYYFWIAIPAYLAIVVLHVSNETQIDRLLAAVYFIFTIIIACYGVSRFLQRGFSHVEEFAIDMGLIYLALGGAWFFAYEAHIDTGFPPLITWLTAIHFHYSAFLLPVFVGFLGRLQKNVLYKVICTIILLSPMIVALGITFSRWLELLSVILYIIGLYGLIVLSFLTRFFSYNQKRLVRISFAALGITIGFSLLYALGSGWGLFIVTIDFMLLFHGTLNCILFALCGIFGWSLAIPKSTHRKFDFPVSKIRAGLVVGDNILENLVDAQTNYYSLVDDMSVYEPGISVEKVSPTIIDFYESTANYRLFAEIKWAKWFKPFAFIYRQISRYVKQINLPLSNSVSEMTGDIFAIKDRLDGRVRPRAWVRKVDGQVTFVALYSEHKTAERTYMNIALPLPWTAMIGILELNQVGKGIQLTSNKQSGPESEAGIYLAWKNILIKLPLKEVFHVEEIENNVLRAEHQMWIFSIPFLTINYKIYHQKLIK